MDIDTLLAQFHSLVDVNKTSLLLSLLAISFNPIAWNIVARNGTWHLFFFFFFRVLPTLKCCSFIFMNRTQKQKYHAYFWRQREIRMLLSRFHDFFFRDSERQIVRVIRYQMYFLSLLKFIYKICPCATRPTTKGFAS